MEPVVRRFLECVREASDAVARGETRGLAPEQAFRTAVESLLPEVFEGWGVVFMPTLERATVTKRRIDMLCGRVVTEYKAPGVLATDAGYANALEQTKDYIEQLSVEFGEPVPHMATRACIGD